MGFSDLQQKAIESPHRLTWVRSGAGTGKTTVIKGRVAHNTEQGKQSLITTFTRDARRELENRIDSGEIRTLGSLAWKLSAPYRKGRKAISDGIRQSVIRAIMSEMALVTVNEVFGEEDVEASLVDMLRGVSLMHSNGIYSRNVDAYPSMDKHMVQVLKDYDAYMDAHTLFDANMMFIHARNSITDAERIYDEILVDESQDLSLGQLELLKALAGEKSSMFLVGDDDQAIYSFRGAIPNLMSKDYPFTLDGPNGSDIGYVELTINYRSTSQILYPALKVVNSNPNHEKKILTSDRNGDSVKITAFSNEKKEAIEIGKSIKTLIEEGVSAGEIAVISRTNRAIESIASELLKANVPFIMADGHFFDRPEVMDIIAYLNLFLNTEDVTSLERIINRPDRKILPPDMESVITGIHAGGLDSVMALRAVAKGTSDKKSAKGLKELADLIEHMSALSQNASGPHMLKAFFERSHYIKNMEKKGSKHFKHSIDAMLNLAKMEENTDFFEFCMMISDRNDSYGESLLVDNSRVFVGTIFGSKGLEWDHVFIPGFVKGEFPRDTELMNVDEGNWIIDGKRSGGLQEEKRILYVALTRARKNCNITWPKARGVGKFAKERQMSPLIYATGINVASTPMKRR